MCFKYYNADEVIVRYVCTLMSWCCGCVRLNSNRSRAGLWSEVSVVFYAGAEGEKDGGVVKVFSLLLAFILWNRWQSTACSVQICLVKPSNSSPRNKHRNVFHPRSVNKYFLTLLFMVTSVRCWSFWVPDSPQTLEWRNPHGSSQEEAQSCVWVFHQARRKKSYSTYQHESIKINMTCCIFS